MLERGRVDGYLDTTDEIEFYLEQLQLDADQYQIEALYPRSLPALCRYTQIRHVDCDL